MSYPKWRYHANQEARIVHTEEEDEKLGSGWSDTPVITAPIENRPKPERHAEPRPEGKPADTGKAEPVQVEAEPEASAEAYNQKTASRKNRL